MQNRPSLLPRDLAIRAALSDVAILSAMAEDEIRASYFGPERGEYARVMREFLADLGGTLDELPDRLVARIRGREISVRF